MAHKTKRTILKEADIDIEIIPIVKWLNSYDSVITWYCCQGDKKEKGQVVFTCTNPTDILNISRIVTCTNPDRRIEVQEWPEATLRYELIFKNISATQEFVQEIKE